MTWNYRIMKQLLCLLLFSPTFCFTQLKSGIYSNELSIIYNDSTKQIKGYYFAESGYDELTKTPRFSCGFYFVSHKVNGNKIAIKSYWPTGTSDTIMGELFIIDSTQFLLKLESEHGGCWNVTHFADTLEQFELTESKNWIDVRWVKLEKSNFHEEPNANKKQKAYLLEGDLVYIEKKEGDWVYCIYYGEKTTTKGWLKIDDLNR